MGDGVSAGTELLTAPEVFRGSKHSRATDVYSIGMSMMSLFGEELVDNCVEY